MRKIPDRAFRVWKANGEPEILSETSKSRRILRAYRKQTAWLSSYAADLALHVENLVYPKNLREG